MIKTNFLFLSNQHWIGRRKVQGGSHGGFSCWFGWSHCNRMGVGSSPKTHSHDISLSNFLSLFPKPNAHLSLTTISKRQQPQWPHTFPLPQDSNSMNEIRNQSTSTHFSIPTNGEKKKQENFGFPFKWNNSKLRYMQAFNNGCVLI